MELVKSFFKRICVLVVKYPLAFVFTIVVVIVACVAWEFGFKLQIGGVLGWLWGKKKDFTPDVIVLPPDGRKDETGKIVLPGQSDDKGYVQSVVIVLPEPSIFSDPNVIVINHPTKGEVVIPLPTGIKSSNVQRIVEITPNVYQITNHDHDSNVKKLLDDLK